MNERIMKNIAYCYASSGENQVDVMMKFATILMGRDVEKLKRFNDYLESALALEETEPSVVALLRECIEDGMDAPERIYHALNNEEGMRDASSALNSFTEHMMKRGYYKEETLYVCPVCRKKHSVEELSSRCPDCGEETVKEITTIERVRTFQDFFAPNELHAKQEMQKRKAATMKESGDDNGYSLPKTFTEKEKTLSDEDIVNNPFFHKRHKSS